MQAEFMKMKEGYEAVIAKLKPEIRDKVVQVCQDQIDGA